MAMRKFTIGTVLAVAAVIVVVAVVTAGLLVTSRTIPNSGAMQTIGVNVYWDSACTNLTTSIPWGTLDSNSSKSYTVYVKNNGTAAEVLRMTTANWNPSAAATYITLSWNRENYTLSHGSYVAAVLTLTVSPSIANITSFSFDITITGTESA